MLLPIKTATSLKGEIKKGRLPNERCHKDSCGTFRFGKQTNTLHSKTKCTLGLDKGLQTRWVKSALKLQRGYPLQFPNVIQIQLHHDEI